MRNPLKITQNDFLRNLKNYDYIGQISNELKEIFGMDEGNNVSKNNLHLCILQRQIKEIIKRNQGFARIANS